MISSNIKYSAYALLAGFLLVTMFGCTQYYKPVPADSSSPQASGKVISSHPEKLFILRQGKYSYGLADITIDNAALTLNANLATLPPANKMYVNAKPRHYAYSYPSVLREVHLYTKDTSALKINQAFSVPLGQIYKIEIIEKDKKRSSGSFVSAGLIIVGTVAAILVIAALTKSSCPFVSVFNGDQYVLQGELFGGAVNPNLQRRDYVPLDIKPFRGEYWLRISNELKERQYTDYADLIFLEHQPDARAGMDATGVPYLLSDPIAPIEASLNHNSDVVDLISQADSVSCTFNDTTSISSLNDLYLSFPNPNAKHEGKLVLRLKNSYWFDYLYGEFMSNFGRRFNHWQKKQRHLPGEKMIQWTREQQIPITVSIATADGWKETFKLNSIGPLMDREVVIPLEWDKHQNDPVQVRLTTGFMFWELNYAVIDYTEDQPVITTTLHPYSAMDETGQDVLAQLLQEDRQFLTQLETGNFATLKYKLDVPLNPAKSYSVVLATKGYYEPIREFSGKPNIVFLHQFKTPGAFSIYSKQQYKSVVKSAPALVQNAN